MSLLILVLGLLLAGAAVGPVQSAAAAPMPQCSDGKDNDGDGKVDYPADPGCVSTNDNDETNPQVVVRLPSNSQSLLSPFPVVRLRAQILNSGIRVSLLTVQAPAGSRITIICRGRRRSCPRAKSTRVTTGRRVRFRGFERRMRSGTVLRIFVTKPGFVGKYTRFTIRRHSAPSRDDACALPDNRSVTCR